MIGKKSIETVQDFDMVIFGATGDLSFRKIFPALYYRLTEGQVKPKSRIAAIVRKKEDEVNFKINLQKKLENSVININSAVLNDLLSKVDVVSISDNSAYLKLEDWFKRSFNSVRVYYLATPSTVFGSIAKKLHEHNLITIQSRIVLEKPLGKDKGSSNEINGEILAYFSENQIYRIDHYLGKETVQNLMVLRFANYLFENSWNSNHIKSVQISAAESLGVEKRGDYYNQYGALLDMVQNHLLQLLCLIAMEPPSMLNADEVRVEKYKVLKSLRLINNQNVEDCAVKGQYSRGGTNEMMLPSYLEDIEDFSSETETFVAIRAYIDNWRWKSVPFYIRTGKRMSEKFSEIVITFKNVPHNVFPEQKNFINNKLIIRLQPKERIEFVQMVKVPGPGGYRYKPVSMKLDYQESFKGRFPDAYERLLMDVVRGNQTLFMSNDELSASWDWITSISNAWKETGHKNNLYKAGTDGPGDEILLNDDQWHKNSSE